MIPLELIVERKGRSALRLTPRQNSLHWSTAALGGFASCGFGLDGDPARWKREMSGANVTALGWQRLLDDQPVRRIWSSRAFEWLDSPWRPDR